MIAALSARLRASHSSERASGGQAYVRSDHAQAERTRFVAVAEPSEVNNDVRGAGEGFIAWLALMGEIVALANVGNGSSHWRSETSHPEPSR